MVFVIPKSVKYVAVDKALFSLLLWGVLLAGYLACVFGAMKWIVSETDLLSLPGAVLIGFIGIIIMIWRLGLPRRFMSPAALGLSFLCAAGSLWTFALLQQLSAGFALMGLYGFAAGLDRITALQWQKGLLMAALAALAIPFALVPGTGAGFYLRLMTADAAAGLLALLGHASLGAHDVLIFDNGIAQVDLPCSGLKSLFTGTGFFLALSLIWRRNVSVKWCVAYGVFIALLLTANTVRVTLLIWISEIMQARDLAETVHTPLGLVLFVLVCIAGIVMLRVSPAYPAANVVKPRMDKPYTWVFSAFAILGLGLVAMNKPAPITENQIAIMLPSGIESERVSLTPTERRFFAARERTDARKWMFSYKGLSGSMLVVRSSAANGLHAPEVCLLGNGISVQSMESRPITLGSGTYRWLTVDEGRRNALYWMQNGDVITDDFRTRLTKYAFENRREWTMVTLLLDPRHNADMRYDENQVDQVKINDLMQTLQVHFRGTDGDT